MASKGKGKGIAKGNVTTSINVTKDFEGAVDSSYYIIAEK